MILLLISLAAGALTVLAPCVLPLLPVVVAGSMEDARNRFAPLIIVASLGLSIVVFTLVLKASTAFISIPTSVWSGIAGAILIGFGLVTLFPHTWDAVAQRLKLGRGSNKLLAAGYQKRNVAGDVMIGLALGPIFSGCSPTYAVILATVLPQSFALGLVDLAAYVAGLSAMLLLIAYLGQRFANRLAFASNPDGWFKKGLGLLFLVLGILIVFGIDKKIETAAVNNNPFDTTTLETRLLHLFKGSGQSSDGASAAHAFATGGLSTNTSIASVPLDQILDGGPGKDGIPALTNPAFVSITSAKSWLSPDKNGIAVTVGHTTRFYPFNIMVWHEIVNDTIEGKHLVVTFCPLCGSAIVFDATVGGKPEVFGVSGKLYESNLLMYDKTTESLWSQIQGKAIVGDKTGTQLALYPAQVISFAELIANHPDARVLSEKTGYARDYTLYPYGNYDSNQDIYFPITVHDNRLPVKEIMYAVPYGAHAVAFRLSDLSETPAKVAVEGSTIMARKINGEVEVRDGKGTLIPGFYTMWFAWAIYHQKDGIVWTSQKQS